MKEKIKECFAFVAFALALIACFVLSSCKIHERYIYITNHDTVIQSHLFRDTIDRWQTRYEYVNGDTVYIKDSVKIYKERIVHDTLNNIVYKDRDVEKEVVKENKVYVWQPFALLAFGVLVFFLWRFFTNRQNNENK